MKPQNNKDSSSKSFSRSRRLDEPAIISVLLAIATCAIFCPVASHSFINFDDPAYITANPHVQGGLTRENILWSFQTGEQGNWHPFTWLSHMLDVQCFGTSAVGPHIVNVGFHIANTLLLFWVFLRMKAAVGRSASVAALFGWHPLHVESVAWMAERKDLLCAFFFLLTLYAYARYVSAVKVRGSGFKVYYSLALVFFVCGLLSKAMLVTLPFVLLLLDFWPLGRLSSRTTFLKLIGEKIPFVVLALVSAIVTFLVQQRGGAVQSLNNLSVKIRLENAVVSYARYLEKTFWPFDLATPYSDTQAWPPIIVIGAGLLLLVFTLVAVSQWRTYPFIATGWFWFCGMLIPVIGIVQVGAQAMADRYTYLPLIGVFIIVVWGADEIFRCWHFPPIAIFTFTMLVLVACGWRTRDQLNYWQNSETLGRHTLAVTTDNWIAAYNLGCYFDDQKRIDEAIEQYRLAVRVKSDDSDSLNRLGFDLTKKGNYTEALPLFEAALQTRPNFVELRYNIANALLHLQRYDEAIGQYRSFLNSRPEHVAALNELGVALGVKGNLGEATICFQTALRNEPNNADTHFNLGKVFALQGKVPEARAQLIEALRLKPGWEQAQRELQNMGVQIN